MAVSSRGTATNIVFLGSELDEATCRKMFPRLIERRHVGETLNASAKARRCIVLSGWACEMRILTDGRRQIFNFITPGEVVEIPARGQQSSRTLVALTRVEFLDCDVILQNRAKLCNFDYERIVAEANTRRDERLLDHMVRLGRQSAYERVVHLLLELHGRLAPVGLAKDYCFRVPLTQEHLADALGLSLVHVNRTLQQLRGEGLVELKLGCVKLKKYARLTSLAGYEAIDEMEKKPRLTPRASYAEQRL